MKSTVILLLGGLAAMVGLSLQEVMPIRCGQMIFFMILAGMMGRRVRLVPPAVMLLSVVIANLFSPNGLVLFSVWRFDVTYGALRLGLLKGALLVGLIYVSRVSVGPGLKIPGRFGALLLQAFAYFEALTEKWPATRGGLFSRVDQLLDEVSGTGQESPPFVVPDRPGSNSSHPPRKSLIAAAALVVAGWGPYIITAIVI